MSPRALTARERDVLDALVRRGTADADVHVSVQDRERWAAQIDGTWAGEACGCGQCPSIVLTDDAGVTPTGDETNVVLSAETEGAILLLFVDDDMLSYLELAPFEGERFAEFPDLARITF